MDGSLRHCFIGLLISLSILFTSFTSVQADCKRVSPCKCVFDDGEALDLTPLGSQDGNPRFQLITRSEDTFYWNPCYPFNITSDCLDVAVCRVRPGIPRDLVYPLGYQDDVLFTINSNDSVQLIYTSERNGTEHARTSFITLECAPGDDDNSTFEAMDVAEPYRYYFKLRSPYACANFDHTTEGTITTPIETTVTTVTPEPPNPSHSTMSGGTDITTSQSPGTTNVTMTTPTSHKMSSSTGPSVLTSTSTTQKPESSKRTLEALLIVAVVVIVGLAVALTLVVLKMKGKICKQPEYDNL